MIKAYKTYQIAEEYRGLTVEGYLKQILHYSGRSIQKLTRKKGILLNGKTVYLQKKVKPGEVLRILSLEDITYGVLPEPGNVSILYEDKDVIVVNKASGVLVHPTGHTLQGTLANFLADVFQQRGELCTIRPIHRLDRDTTGCVVFAKDSRTQAMLEEQLHKGLLKRRYLTVAVGKVEPPSGTINAPIGKHPALPNRRVIKDNGDYAITHYRTLQNYPDFTLLELELETGRTHQIRLHLAHIGHPVLGDRMYGKRSSVIDRQALHAVSVHFLHPFDHREINVEAPVPSDIKGLIQADSILI